MLLPPLFLGTEDSLHSCAVSFVSENPLTQLLCDTTPFLGLLVVLLIASTVFITATSLASAGYYAFIDINVIFW